MARAVAVQIIIAKAEHDRIALTTISITSFLTYLVRTTAFRENRAGQLVFEQPSLLILTSARATQHRIGISSPGCFLA
jgi:hypothetical protein